MSSRNRDDVNMTPITTRGRVMLSGFFLLASLIIGFACSVGLYHVSREAIQKSVVMGYLLCGEGQFVGDAPSGRNGIRLLCRDASGAEVSARNNLVAVKMALPFFLFTAMPALLFAWRADLHGRRRR